MKRWLAMMGFVSLAATGCATGPWALTFTEADARQLLLERTASEVIYRRAPDEVMAAARAVLEEQGYQVQLTTDPSYVRTEWKVDGSAEQAGYMSQYLVLGQQLKDGRFVVRVHERELAHGGQVLQHSSAAPALPRPMAAMLQAPTGGGNSLALATGTPMALGTPTVRRATWLEWAILSRLEPTFTAEVAHQVDVYVANHRPPEEVDETL